VLAGAGKQEELQIFQICRRPIHHLLNVVRRDGPRLGRPKLRVGLGEVFTLRIEDRNTLVSSSDDGLDAGVRAHVECYPRLEAFHCPRDIELQSGVVQRVADKR